MVTTIMLCNILVFEISLHYSYSFFQTHTVVHVPSGNCLELDDGGKDVHMNKCSGSSSQEWLWDKHFTPQRKFKDWF